MGSKEAVGKQQSAQWKQDPSSHVVLIQPKLVQECSPTSTFQLKTNWFNSMGWKRAFFKRKLELNPTTDGRSTTVWVTWKGVEEISADVDKFGERNDANAG